MEKLYNQTRQVVARLRKYHGQKEFTKTDVKAEMVSIKDAPLTLAEQDILFDILLREKKIESSQHNTSNTFCLTKKALNDLSFKEMLKLPLALIRA